jgi:hypothetical protein
MRVGVPDRALTGNAGPAAVGELCPKLGVIEPIDATAGPVNQRTRWLGAGGAGDRDRSGAAGREDFLTGLDRQRPDSH